MTLQRTAFFETSKLPQADKYAVSKILKDEFIFEKLKQGKVKVIKK